MNFKIVFHMDGTGVYFDINEPVHLDGFLAWCLLPMQTTRRGITRTDMPFNVRLPLLESTVRGEKVWNASAILPEAPYFETLKFWRKRFRTNRIELCKSNPNLKSGAYRNYNMPMQVYLTKKMVAYASGKRKEVKRILRKNARAIGKKISYGYGKIIDMEFFETDENYSLTKDGHAMRWLPDKNGIREVRMKPPYWNQVDTVRSCEIGDEYDI